MLQLCLGSSTASVRNKIGVTSAKEADEADNNLGHEITPMILFGRTLTIPSLFGHFLQLDEITRAEIWIVALVIRW